jgi:twinkle protein
MAKYPWEGLNEKTGGIWGGELVAIKAFPKIGKTTWLSEVAYHLRQTTPYKLGFMYLEETKDEFVYRFVSMKLNENVRASMTSLMEDNFDSILERNGLKSLIELEEAPEDIRQKVDAEVKSLLYRQDVVDAYEDLSGDGTDRFILFENFGSCASDVIEEKIREFVLACDCRFIFFDHISMAITDESNKDERLALDRLVVALKTLTTGITETLPNGTERTVKPTLFVVTHVNDDGKPRGSRAILQMANTVIDLSRDKASEDQAIKNILNVTVTENRKWGKTGLACQLRYNWETTRLEDMSDAFIHEPLNQGEDNE